MVFAKKEIIIHFGRNPVSGGSPAKDKRRMVITGNIIWDFDISEENWFIDLVVIEASIKNRGATIVVYNARYSVARIGLLMIMALSIHPMWVIDE